MDVETIADEWADRYGSLRYSGPAAASAWLGIPLVLTALMGLLWSVPVPDVLRQTTAVINAATLWVMATFVYYCILSIRLALGGMLILLLTLLPCVWIDRADLPILPLAVAAFVPAFAWQLAETRRATGRLGIVDNLQYLMLGPIWLLRAAYRRTGLTY